jgi:hypothetical protein
MGAFRSAFKSFAILSTMAADFRILGHAVDRVRIERLEAIQLHSIRRLVVAYSIRRYWIVPERTDVPSLLTTYWLFALDVKLESPSRMSGYLENSAEYSFVFFSHSAIFTS